MMIMSKLEEKFLWCGKIFSVLRKIVSGNFLRKICQFCRRKCLCCSEEILKNMHPWPKTPLFGAEGAENIKKLRFFIKLAFDEVLRENVAKFWLTWWFRTNLSSNSKMIANSIFKKFRNFVWKFWEIVRKIFSDLKLHVSKILSWKYNKTSIVWGT